MDALFAAALEAAGGGLPPRIVVVPTAVARHRPQLSAREGIDSFQAAARRAGSAATVEAAMVVDATSAADGALAATLDGAHLVYLPGGDPDVIPTVFPGSAAWDAMRRAYEA